MTSVGRFEVCVGVSELSGRGSAMAENSGTLELLKSLYRRFGRTALYITSAVQRDVELQACHWNEKDGLCESLYRVCHTLVIGRRRTDPICPSLIAPRSRRTTLDRPFVGRNGRWL